MESLRKRKASPELVTNPFVKKRNLEWRVSPPPLRNPERKRRGEGSEGRRDVGGQRPTGLTQVTATTAAGTSEDAENQQPPSPPRTDRPLTSALIESAQVQISDHLAYFSRLLAAHTLDPFPPRVPRLPVPRYSALYQRSLGSALGAHFVVTQHDHPVAGPHYDLRLQINETSSCSWAIMYGLPGDPNARGRNGRAGGGAQRNATETRVHCLWNHLVETGGRETGSLLIWDAGEYEVLRPGRGWKQQQPSSGSEGEGEEEDGGWWDGLSQQERLARAFAGRRIRLRLNGARLPRPYVVNIRLTRDEDAAGRAKAARAGERPRRRRRAQPRPAPRSTGPDTSSSGEDGPDPDPNQAGGEEEDDYDDGSKGKSAEGLTEMEKELRELEDEEVRRTNAYTGAVNTIGSVHQRKWFLSLDREACGFVRGIKDGRVWWDRAEDGGDEEEGGGEGGNRLKWPFYLHGPDHERSAVTGRLGGDVLKDEGVAGYVGRKGWRPILN